MVFGPLVTIRRVAVVLTSVNRRLNLQNFWYTQRHCFLEFCNRQLIIVVLRFSVTSFVSGAWEEQNTFQSHILHDWSDLEENKLTLLKENLRLSEYCILWRSWPCVNQFWWFLERSTRLFFSRTLIFMISASDQSWMKGMTSISQRTDKATRCFEIFWISAVRKNTKKLIN